MMRLSRLPAVCGNSSFRVTTCFVWNIWHGPNGRESCFFFFFEGSGFYVYVGLWNVPLPKNELKLRLQVETQPFF